MPVFSSRIDPLSPQFSENSAYMGALVEQVEALEARTRARSDKRKALFDERGQIPPRERLQRILDPGAPFVQLGNMAGYLQDTPDAERSLPGATCIAGIGFVAGARCMLLVSDSGINAGALSAATGKKILRAFTIAERNKLPMIHLVESAGANLVDYSVQMFVEVGEIFGRHAVLSGQGIPVVTVLHGSSTAGGAYMPGMSDVVIAVRDRGHAFLAGPPLLKAATGEIADAAELGGAEMHATISGLVEHLAEDDADALRIAREAVDRLGWERGNVAKRPSDFAAPVYDPAELLGIVPQDHRQPYDVRDIMARIVDGSDFLDFKPRYGVSTVCAEATIHGYPVALIGNNGPIDTAGANKATHFIQHCCQVGTPLVFLQNTTGFMVGMKSEHAGMIKHGSKMIQAVTLANVPRITIQVGASFGAGNYGMCGRGYHPDFLFSWPNARTGVMGAEQAATTMRIVAEQRLARRGLPVDVASLDAESDRLRALYSSQEDVLITSGLGLDDGIIDPRDTRRVLGFCLATVAESQARTLRPVSFGVARP